MVKPPASYSHKPETRYSKYSKYSQGRMKDFPQVGMPTPKNLLFCQFFAINCMKMKEFGSPGGART